MKSFWFKKQNGFTLIELLTVISIIGLLSSIILASLQAAKEKARIAAGLQFAANMEHAYGAYAVGSWNLDGIVGGQVLDTSGANNNGTLIGSGIVESSDVPSGFPLKKSISFSGQDGSYISTTVKSMSLKKGFTLMAWVMPLGSSLGGNLSMIMGGNRPYLALKDLDRRKIAFNAGSGTTPISGSTPLDLMRWYLVAATYESDGNKGKIYLDGKLDGTGVFTDVAIDPTVFCIGNYNPSDTNKYGFKGNIAYARFYNMALSTAEIEKIYAEESGGKLFTLK